MKYRFISLLLCLSLLFGVLTAFSACDTHQEPIDSEIETSQSSETDSDIPTQTDPPITIPVEYDPPASEFISTQFAFALKLFKESLNQQEGNDSMLISPLSIALALAMTANGAEGETLAELEELLGLPVSELNEEFENFVGALTSRDKAKLHIANSIWLKESEVALRKEFADLTAQYYKADVHARPFDRATADEINAWVDRNTDGMIKKLFDELDPEAVLYLINALVFDAKWASQYQKIDVRSDEFLSIDGILKKVDMLKSEEYGYLNDGMAQGFVKNYEGNYCFVAMLPREDVSLDQYVAQLDTQKLYALVNNPLKVSVDVSIPKFKYEYSANLADTLQAMGLDRCFVGQGADFSGIGSCSSGDLAINRVLHKTAIELTEAGTRAAAVTAVEEVPESEPMPPAYSVTLNRPFVYMILDRKTCLPIFMGTVTDIPDGEVLGQKESVELVYEDSIEVSLMYEPEVVRELFADFLVTQKNQKPYGPTMMRIGSEEELAAFTAICLSNRTPFSPSLPEGFFKENCLIVTHQIAFSGMVEYDIREAALLRNQGNTQLVLNVDARCPYMMTDDEKCWFIVAGLSKEAATPDREYSVQFENIFYVPEEVSIPLDGVCVKIDCTGESAPYLAEIAEPSHMTDGNTFIKIDNFDDLKQLNTVLQQSVFRTANTEGDMSYTQLVEELDASYFEKYSLIIAYVAENSEITRHRLKYTSLYHQGKIGKDTVIMTVERMRSAYDKGDTGMAGWFICHTTSKQTAEINNLYYEIEFQNSWALDY